MRRYSACIKGQMAEHSPATDVLTAPLSAALEDLIRRQRLYRGQRHHLGVSTSQDLPLLLL